MPTTLFVLSGLLYLARALMDLGNPKYYDPSTLFDYAAVLTTTLAMVALGAAIASLATTRTLAGAARIVAWVPSVALIIGGIGNLIEDMFLKGFANVGEDAASAQVFGYMFAAGGGLGLLGLIVLGVSTLLVGGNDRVIGVVLLLLGLAFTLPTLGRLAGVPILCFAMAYVLNRRTDRSGESESQTPGAVEAAT